MYLTLCILDFFWWFYGYLIFKGASVTLHTILLGVSGTIYNNHTLEPFEEELGLNSQKASPGFDCVAASFIKNAVVVRPKPDGRGSERVNVLAPYIAQ